MSKGSAIVAIIVAFVMGGFIGNLVGSKNAKGGEEVAAVEGNSDVAEAAAAAAALPGAPERFKVPATKAQPQKGPDDALVTIVQWSDFECPFCKRVEPTVDRIMKEYKGKVRVQWRNNPLPFHKNAMPAAEASAEAHAQGKFWEMHTKLFENPRAMTMDNLKKWAGEIGLDMAKFDAAMTSHKHQAAIKADQALGAKFGARGTPAFFINGRFISGAQPFDNFKKIIDEEITSANALVKKGTAKGKVYAALTAAGKLKADPPKPQKPANARPQPDPKAVYKLELAGKMEPAKGAKSPLVTIVEFSDFECPFCGRVEPTVDQILKEYPEEVRVVWMNNPLSFHKNAMPAANAAMEAYAQGGDKKFWEMHKKMFANQKAAKPTRENLDAWAKEIGLNMGKFKTAMDGLVHKDAITAQQAKAVKLGARGTPSFFINGRNVRGAQPFPNFKTVIDEEIARAKKLVAAGTPRAQVYAAAIKNGATAPKMLPGAKGGAAPDANKIYKIDAPKKAPFKGNKNAKVVIYEYSDFQCPFCSRVNPTMKQVMDKFGDKVKIVWRHYPLPFHKQAPLASQAAHEVFLQGGNDKFWAFHDKLFANQKALMPADLEKYAQEIGGINMGAFKSALATQKHKAVVDADVASIAKAGARIGTPSFFINGKLVQGAQPFPAFEAAINEALKK